MVRTNEQGFAALTKQRLERVACIVRRVIGVPDYDRYVGHMRAHHPGDPLLSREEFIQQRQVDRYSKPGARCC